MGTEQKVAVITGASQGIGAALVKAYRDRNYRVVATARSIKPSDDDDVLAVAGDIADPKTAERVIAQAVARFGRVDTLVNNAGITQDAQMKKMTDDQFDQVIEVNLKGVFNCTKVVVDLMLAQGSGCILNASSIVGIYGNFGQTNYAASKFGVIGYTKTWSRELGKKGIRVNAVAPGLSKRRSCRPSRKK